MLSRKDFSDLWKMVYNLLLKPYKCGFGDTLLDTAGAGGREKRTWTWFCSSLIQATLFPGVPTVLKSM